jgi:hypothetical protein
MIVKHAVATTKASSLELSMHNLKEWLIRQLQKLARRLLNPVVEPILHQLTQSNLSAREREITNPVLACGRRYFSQNDEDGILLEILRRIAAQSPATFLELGVGDGTECNTIILLALGWRGAWLGGQALAFEPGPRLAFSHNSITKENVISLATEALRCASSHNLISPRCSAQRVLLRMPVLDHWCRFEHPSGRSVLSPPAPKFDAAASDVVSQKRPNCSAAKPRLAPTVPTRRRHSLAVTTELAKMVDALAAKVRKLAFAASGPPTDGKASRMVTALEIRRGGSGFGGMKVSADRSGKSQRAKYALPIRLRGVKTRALTVGKELSILLASLGCCANEAGPLPHLAGAD